MYEMDVIMAVDKLNSAYVCIAVCDSELLLMFDALEPMRSHRVTLPSCTILLCKYTNYTPGKITVNKRLCIMRS